MDVEMTLSVSGLPGSRCPRKRLKMFNVDDDVDRANDAKLRGFVMG